MKTKPEATAEENIDRLDLLFQHVLTQVHEADDQDLFDLLLGTVVEFAAVIGLNCTHNQKELKGFADDFQNWILDQAAEIQDQESGQGLMTQ